MGQKAKRVTCYVLFRCLLPLVLLGAAIVRFNGFSLLYFCLVLAEPLLPSPNPTSMAGSTGNFLTTSLVLSSLTLAAQVAFQSYLLILAGTDGHPYGQSFKNCSMLERSLRQVGLQRVEPNNYGNILRVILPDMGAFLVILLVFIICKKLAPVYKTSARPRLQRQQSILRKRLESYGTYILNILGNFLVALFLAASGIANPSVLSSVYFVAFLGLATWWACYKSLGQRFANVRIVLLVYSGAHLLLLYLYQFQFFQIILVPGTFISRVVGMTGLVLTDCRKPWLPFLNPEAKWWMYVSPALILLLYFTLACEIRRWAHRVKEIELNQSGGQSPTHGLQSPSHGGGRLLRRRRAPSSSERQALVTDAQQTYNSTDPTDNASISPQSDIYGNEEPDSGDTSCQAKKIRSPIISLFVYIMKQSYVATLIIMMVWSITYHSWLTFVYLIAACIIWMVPHKRSVCLKTSPVIVFYAEGLLIIQYVYGFSMTDTELPIYTDSGYQLAQIGLKKYLDPCIPLGVQIAFTVVFLLTLRQHMRELHLDRQNYYMTGLVMQPYADPEQPPTPHTSTSQAPTSSPGLIPGMGDVIDGHDSDTMKALGYWLWRMLCKYWIIICSILLLIISITEPVIYRIIYMVFFLYFVLTFQLCYRWWRFTVYVFWWVVIVYSMMVLLCIYTFQFENFPGYWTNGTHMSLELLSDVGLEKFDTATLFAKLLTPTSFVIVVCLQVHYFQKAFLEFSDINRFKHDAPEEDKPIGVPLDAAMAETPGEPEEPTPGTSGEDHMDGVDQNDGQMTDQADGQVHASTSQPATHSYKPLKKRIWAKLKRGVLKFYSILDRLSVLIWRLLEIHMAKFVMFTIFICCLVDINAINVVFVFLVTVFMPVPAFQTTMSNLCQCYVALAILAKMTYQLKLVKVEAVLSNCSQVLNVNDSNPFPYPFNSSIDNADYIGLDKARNLPHYLQNYVIIVCILAFEAIVRYHQAQYYNKPGKERPPVGIVFRHTRREHADTGLVPCLKYFVNYSFYKFGLQICFIMTMVTMVVRLDAYSVIYGVFLAVLLGLERKQCYYMWPAYIIVLLVLLVLQYLACVGVPPGLCWGYPWDIIPDITTNLKIYLFLPNYIDKPDSYLLMADFFQLLFVCLQWGVFRIESSQDCERYGGGSNKCILADVEADKPNPVQDFLYCKNSYLDYVKLGIFYYSFWATLIILFIAGTAKISLFSLFYLVGFFFFLWFGMELLTKPLRKVVKMWSILLGYNFFVILSKSCLQLVGCVYLSRVANSYCWVIQLLGLACVKAGNYVYKEEKLALQHCNQSEGEAGLTWDAICFVFLLLQLRIYKSHYFRHVVIELEVQNQFASRGAELINTRLITRVGQQKNRERETLAQIKRKMEKIRLRQERLQQKALTETDDHYIVIRSGDYYMFDEDDEDETESSVDLDNFDQQEESDDEEKAGPLKILNAAMTGGTRRALKEIERQRTISEEPKTPTTPRAERTPLVVVPEGSTMSSSDDDGDGSPRDEKQITLKEEEDKEEDDDEEADKKETCCQKFMNGLKIAWAFIGSVLDSMIQVLRKISYEYRNVSLILDREKEQYKKAQRVEEEAGLVPLHVASPTPQDEAVRAEESRTLLARRRTDVAIKVFTSEAEGSQDRPSMSSAQDLSDPMETEREFRRHMPRILQLLFALFEAIMARSEMLCYFAMILNTLVNASVLSIPYPLSVFLWAMLSVPRPSKTYWITIITYTEAVVVVKYLFQFGFFPWNESKGLDEGDPFWPPRIIGIERKDRYAAFDLVLLFCLFVHRSVLSRHGLWKDAVEIDADFAEAEHMIASCPNTAANSPLVKSRGAEVPAIELSDSLGADNATYEPSTNRSTPDVSHAPALGASGGDVNKDAGKAKQGCCATCFQPMLDFYRQMTNARYNAVTDVYATMFFCDFIAFLIVVFGYSAFGPEESTGAAGTEVVATVIQNNRVPAPFLAMLLVQFVLIIVDRALYLRKNIFGKFMFQIILVILVHVWMFFILPAVTKRVFTENVPAQLWYFIKCVYFGLSAYQIRSGYPTRILGNFLTKRYNYVNLFLFKGFLLIPFLLELRALMDWMWTDTTLALSSWLKMEDIYASIFELKCWRWAEKKYPTPRGLPRRKIIKYGVGGLLLFLLIFIIWFPLLLFSLASAVFEPNPPVDCSIEMKFGSFQPVFKMSAQQNQLKAMTAQSYHALREKFRDNVSANAFLASYQPEDVYTATINGISTATWDISPPSEKALRDQLEGETTDINLITTVSFIREPKSGMKSETVATQFVKTMKASNPLMKEIRKRLSEMINGTYDYPVDVSNVFPPFVQVPVDGKPTAALPMLGPTNESWSDISFVLKRDEGQDDVMWWNLDEIPNAHWRSKANNDPISLTLISFNERVAPGVLNILTSYGIIGLYVSLVFVIGQLVRMGFIGHEGQIMFTELPSVDNILRLCLEIYLVRESGEWVLEEQLYSKLVFVYRSPETIIRWTKAKVQ